MNTETELVPSKETLLPPARVQSPTSLAEFSEEELDTSIKEYIGGALTTLRRCKPLVEEMQRRFKIMGYGYHPDGTPRTIAGCRSFEEYCTSVLNRSKQAVYLMLREEKQAKEKPAKIPPAELRYAAKRAAAEDEKVPYCEMAKRAADSLAHVLENPYLEITRDQRALRGVGEIAELEKLIKAYRRGAEFILAQIAPVEARLAFLRELDTEEAANG